jgi:hypothetical protein
MNNWKCGKCKALNAQYVTRCSFCSTPRPSIEAQAVIDEQIANKPIDDLKQTIHNAIERMTPHQRTILWRFMEDNLI